MSWSGWENFDPGVAPGAPKKPKRSKYAAQPHRVLPDLRVVPEAECAGTKTGLKFMSRREADRFVALFAMKEAKAISALEIQPQFTMHVTAPDGTKRIIGRYIADFQYRQDGALVVEDAKGLRTEVYKLKKKHVEAEYAIEIREV